MKLLRPMAVTSAALTSSNVAETVALYNGATTYALAAQVRQDAADGSWIYQSLVGSNTGNPLTDATKWVRVGATNRWSMFDASVTSQTEAADQIEVVIATTGRVDSVAVVNVDAASIQVVAEDATDGVVFDETYSLVSTSGITDLYAWLTEPIERISDFEVTGLPSLYSGLTITVTLTNTGGTAKCGALVVGLSKTIGTTSYGASVGIIDYSRKEANAYGDYEVVERAFAKRANFTVWIDTRLTDQVQKLLAEYRATPIVYVGSSSFGSTIVFGFYRSFSVEIAYPSHSICSLEIEGLT